MAEHESLHDETTLTGLLKEKSVINWHNKMTKGMLLPYTLLGVPRHLQWQPLAGQADRGLGAASKTKSQRCGRNHTNKLCQSPPHSLLEHLVNIMEYNRWPNCALIAEWSAATLAAAVAAVQKMYSSKLAGLHSICLHRNLVICSKYLPLGPFCGLCCSKESKIIWARYSGRSKYDGDGKSELAFGKCVADIRNFACVPPFKIYTYF